MEGKRCNFIQHQQISLMNSQKKRKVWADFQFPTPTRAQSWAPSPRILLQIYKPNCRNSLNPHHIPKSPRIPSSSVDFVFYVFLPSSSDDSLHPLRQQGMFNIGKTHQISFQGSLGRRKSSNQGKATSPGWHRAAFGNLGRWDPTPAPGPRWGNRALGDSSWIHGSERFIWEAAELRSLRAKLFVDEALPAPKTTVRRETTLITSPALSRQTKIPIPEGRNESWSPREWNAPSGQPLAGRSSAGLSRVCPPGTSFHPGWPSGTHPAGYSSVNPIQLLLKFLTQVSF